MSDERTVSMHFGDGSFKTIAVEATTKSKAEDEARTWVLDNMFFEADPDCEWEADDED